MPYAHITGWGMAVPETILTNQDLSEMVDTNDEWIRDRTGIKERHIAHCDKGYDSREPETYRHRPDNLLNINAGPYLSGNCLPDTGPAWGDKSWGF